MENKFSIITTNYDVLIEKLLRKYCYFALMEFTPFTKV